jgi:hypothetical protein
MALFARVKMHESSIWSDSTTRWKPHGNNPIGSTNTIDLGNSIGEQFSRIKKVREKLRTGGNQIRDKRVPKPVVRDLEANVGFGL